MELEKKIFGFGWDDERHTVTAPLAAWEALHKAHKDTKGTVGGSRTTRLEKGTSCSFYILMGWPPESTPGLYGNPSSRPIWIERERERLVTMIK
jgi:acetylornithine deacetylase/succinyl-diaminopimelate desuccinylase-like protein